MNNKTWIAYPALLCAMTIWGSSFIALKIAFLAYDPLFVIFGRMFLGTLCLVPVLWKGIPLIRKQDLPLFILMAVFEPCLYFLFEAKALTLTTASQAGMITSILPLLVGITAVFYLKEKLNGPIIIGFALAVAGVVWLTMTGSQVKEAPNPPLGNLMELAAMVCAAGYTLTLKKLTFRYSPFLLTGVQILIGCLFFLPFCFFPSSRIPVQWSLTGTLSVLYLGVVVTLGGYGLYNFGTSRLPANRSSAFINLIPVVSLLLSILILKEKVGLAQLLSSALILSGVVVSQMRIGEKKTLQEPEAAL